MYQEPHGADAAIAPPDRRARDRRPFRQQRRPEERVRILGETVDFNFMIGTSVCSAMESFTRSLGGGSLNDGIRVIGVSPGAVATPVSRSSRSQKARLSSVRWLISA